MVQTKGALGSVPSHAGVFTTFTSAADVQIFDVALSVDIADPALCRPCVAPYGNQNGDGKNVCDTGARGVGGPSDERDREPGGAMGVVQLSNVAFIGRVLSGYL